jgi:hypothetical protein
MKSVNPDLIAVMIVAGCLVSFFVGIILGRAL